MRGFPLLLGLLALASPAWARPHAVAHLKDLDGKPVGIVTFSTVDRGVLIEFDLTACRPDRTASICMSRAIATPRPASPAPGRSCHVGSAGPQAWLSGRRRPGSGRPAQPVRRRRRPAACPVILTNGFTLGNGKRSIFDRDGVSIIVDQRGDDYRTQPMGNAGDAHRLRRGDADRRARCPRSRPMATAKAGTDGTGTEPECAWKLRRWRAD